MDRQTAELLYMGIMTDTGSFCYDNKSYVKFVRYTAILFSFHKLQIRWENKVAGCDDFRLNSQVPAKVRESDRRTYRVCVGPCVRENSNASC